LSKCVCSAANRLHNERWDTMSHKIPPFFFPGGTIVFPTQKSAWLREGLHRRERWGGNHLMWVIHWRRRIATARPVAPDATPPRGAGRKEGSCAAREARGPPWSVPSYSQSGAGLAWNWPFPGLNPSAPFRKLGYAFLLTHSPNLLAEATHSELFSHLESGQIFLDSKVWFGSMPSKSRRQISLSSAISIQRFPASNAKSQKLNFS